MTASFPFTSASLVEEEEGDSAVAVAREESEFLTEKCADLADENDNLLAIIRRALKTLNALQGLEDEEEEEEEERRTNFMEVTPTNYDLLNHQLEESLLSLQQLINQPNYVSIEEVTKRDEQIIRLKEDLLRVEGEWKKAIGLVDHWNKTLKKDIPIRDATNEADAGTVPLPKAEDEDEEPEDKTQEDSDSVEEEEEEEEIVHLVEEANKPPPTPSRKVSFDFDLIWNTRLTIAETPILWKSRPAQALVRRQTKEVYPKTRQLDARRDGVSCAWRSRVEFGLIPLLNVLASLQADLQMERETLFCKYHPLSFLYKALRIPS